MSMPLFNAVIRIGSSLSSEILRQNATPAELLLLQEIHGPDCIARLERAGVTNIRSSEERRRLENVYGIKRVQAAFGASDYSPLPVVFPGADEIINRAPVHPVSADVARERARAELLAELAAAGVTIPATVTAAPDAGDQVADEPAADEEPAPAPARRRAPRTAPAANADDDE